MAWGRNMFIIIKYVWLLSFHLQLLEYRSFRLRWNKSVVSWLLSMSFGFIYSNVWKNNFQVPTKWGYFFNRPSKRKFKVLSYLWSEKANKLGLIRENIAVSWRLLLGGFVLNITLYIPHQPLLEWNVHSWAIRSISVSVPLVTNVLPLQFKYLFVVHRKLSELISNIDMLPEWIGYIKAFTPESFLFFKLFHADKRLYVFALRGSVFKADILYKGRW